MNSEDHASDPLNVKPVSNQKSKDRKSRRIYAYRSSHLDRFLTFVSDGDQNQPANPVKLSTVQKNFSVSRPGERARAALANGMRDATGSGVAMEV